MRTTFSVYIHSPYNYVDHKVSPELPLLNDSVTVTYTEDLEALKLKYISEQNQEFCFYLVKWNQKSFKDELLEPEWLPSSVISLIQYVFSLVNRCTVPLTLLTTQISGREVFPSLWQDWCYLGSGVWGCVWFVSHGAFSVTDILTQRRSSCCREHLPQ